MQQRRGFTLVESVVLLATLSIAGALGAAAITLNGEKEQALQSQTQLRGIHQAQVTFAQSNKRGGQDGFFSGLDALGNIVDASTEGRHQFLLEGNYYTGEYIISPIEDLTAWEFGDDPDQAAAVLPENHSYAMLRIGEPALDIGRREEWKETLNTSAVVLSDRNTATPEDPRSVWSEGQEHADWAGGMTRNDNSTSFESSPIVEQTYYGNPPSRPKATNPGGRSGGGYSNRVLGGENPKDHLFRADTPTGHDALLSFTLDAAGQEVVTPRRHNSK